MSIAGRLVRHVHMSMTAANGGAGGRAMPTQQDRTTGQQDHGFQRMSARVPALRPLSEKRQASAILHA
jgi:hypothetical protein